MGFREKAYFIKNPLKSIYYLCLTLLQEVPFGSDLFLFSFAFHYIPGTPIESPCLTPVIDRSRFCHGSDLYIVISCR